MHGAQENKRENIQVRQETDKKRNVRAHNLSDIDYV